MDYNLIICLSLPLCVIYFFVRMLKPNPEFIVFKTINHGTIVIHRSKIISIETGSLTKELILQYYDQDGRINHSAIKNTPRQIKRMLR